MYTFSMTADNLLLEEDEGPASDPLCVLSSSNSEQGTNLGLPFLPSMTPNKSSSVSLLHRDEESSFLLYMNWHE